MVRGGKAGCKRNPKKRAKSRDQGSDDSDEDYVVSDEETDASEDAVGELEVSALEDSIDAFVEDENEEEDEDEDDEDYDGSGAGGADEDDDDVNEDEEDEEEEEEEEDEEEDTKKVVHSKSKPNSGSSRQRKAGNRISLKKGSDSFEEDDEEFDVNDEDDEEDDDEFAPDEDDYLDDEEDSVAKKSYRSKVNTARRKLGGRGLQRKVSRGHRKRKKSSTSRNPSRKMARKRRVVQKKPKFADDDDGDDEDDVDFVGTHNVWREKRKNSCGRRKRRYVASSDSDFMSSGSSGCDYTISEEEREQVREANEYCGDLKPSLRSSLSSKRLKKGGCFCLRSSSISDGTKENHDQDEQTKPIVIKGKEKVEEVNIVKQVCGICLSEEDKRRVRGRLDCCGHYFCFKCVMEWSKVETRCPLCKQRFRAISKPARSTAGIDLRDVVIPVPERDQVSFCLILHCWFFRDRHSLDVLDIRVVLVFLDIKWHVVSAGLSAK